MRVNVGVYGGDMSAAHYFRAVSYGARGMLPWLMVAERRGCEGKKPAELGGERMEKFPCSGEINRKVENSKAVLAAMEEKYGDDKIDKLDGLSIEYNNWRFNVRVSNTEPVMRLNGATRGDKALLKEKTEEILAVIGGEEA